MKPFLASHHLDTCSWEVWRKSIQGKWQKWCVVPVTKNNASATHSFALSLKPIARFRWKRARLSLFRPQPHLPSFIQIHPSSRDLLAKTTFQIITIIGDPISPIGYRIADNKNAKALKAKRFVHIERRSVNRCDDVSKFCYINWLLFVDPAVKVDRNYYCDFVLS